MLLVDVVGCSVGDNGAMEVTREARERVFSRSMTGVDEFAEVGTRISLCKFSIDCFVVVSFSLCPMTMAIRVFVVLLLAFFSSTLPTFSLYEDQVGLMDR
ncbi:hypothetical protein Dimus_039260 [Dionaea muscipula]